jgi:hypothetical protein
LLGSYLSSQFTQNRFLFCGPSIGWTNSVDDEIMMQPNFNLGYP